MSFFPFSLFHLLPSRTVRNMTEALWIEWGSTRTTRYLRRARIHVFTRMMAGAKLDTREVLGGRDWKTSSQGRATASESKTTYSKPGKKNQVWVLQSGKCILRRRGVYYPDEIIWSNVSTDTRLWRKDGNTGSLDWEPGRRRKNREIKVEWLWEAVKRKARDARLRQVIMLEPIYNHRIAERGKLMSARAEPRFFVEECIIGRSHAEFSWPFPSQIHGVRMWKRAPEGKKEEIL